MGGDPSGKSGARTNFMETMVVSGEVEGQSFAKEGR